MCRRVAGLEKRLHPRDEPRRRQEGAGGRRKGGGEVQSPTGLQRQVRVCAVYIHYPRMGRFIGYSAQCMVTATEIAIL